MTLTIHPNDDGITSRVYEVARRGDGVVGERLRYRLTRAPLSDLSEMYGVFTAAGETLGSARRERGHWDAIAARGERPARSRHRTLEGAIEALGVGVTRTGVADYR